MIVELRADPQAHGAHARPEDREPHALGLRHGHAGPGRPFGSRQADELDDPGSPGGNEVDGDLDLAQSDVERIGFRGAAEVRLEVWHTSNLGRGSKTKRAVMAQMPLNIGSTTADGAGQTASTSASANWLL